jgi:hypothetical protein
VVREAFVDNNTQMWIHTHNRWWFSARGGAAG